MSELAKTSLTVGCLIGFLFLPCLVAPARFAELIRRFPRSRAAAWALTALCLAWSAWLILRTPLATIEIPGLGMPVDFEALKPVMFALVPLFFLAIVCFMDELLAPRALGGVFMLAAAPMLDAARMHGSEARVAVVLLAYVLVVAGMTWTLGPHLFRKTFGKWTEDASSCRIAGTVGTLLGVAFVLLALTLY